MWPPGADPAPAASTLTGAPAPPRGRAALLLVELLCLGGCGSLLPQERPPEPDSLDFFEVGPDLERPDQTESDRDRGRRTRDLILGLDRLDLEQLRAFVEPISFDRNRAAVIAAGLPLLEQFTGRDLVLVLSWMSRDAGRESLLPAALPELRLLLFDESLAAVAQFSNESARLRALTLLAGVDDTAVAEAELVQACGFFSEEQNRLATLALLVPLLDGQLGLEAAESLVGTCAYDLGRLRVIEVLAPQLRTLPVGQRERLMDMLDHAQSRRRAKQILSP